MVLAIKSLGKIVEIFEIDSLKLFKEDPRVILIKILHISVSEFFKENISYKEMEMIF